MAFEPGTRLGPYEIIVPIGEGGMGEVYRARDTRLDRTVAIKVLSGSLAADAESRQRFEQEARAIAALNDPHICTIHDIGRHGDLDYIVLEHLEGETLASRVMRTPIVPVDEALAIAVQIGDALDRAHRAGISHRDLKPGNVMLIKRPGATGAPDVKLLDFGLASRTATSRPSGLDASLAATMAPSMVATRPPSATVSSGFSGTVQYMSPEQLDGGEGDHRVDIFAFGCVLYEMLAGRKAFEGKTAMTAIAAIMSSEPPPIPALQSQPHLDHLLNRCLEKDRDRRWQSIGDVTGELRWAMEHPMPAVGAVAPPTLRSRMWGLVGIGALLLAFLAVGLTYRAIRRMTRPNDVPSFRLELTTPPTDDPTMALTGDGRQIAFIANQNRIPMLWVRSIDGPESRVLPGTENASNPFWSPDGRSIGFFADGKVKRIDVDGGRPIAVADAANGRGGSWNSDGVILFSPGVQDPIMRVSIRGGRAERATEPNAGGSGPDHRWPQFLPDGKRFLFSSTLGAAETRGIFIGSLDKTTPVRVLAAAAGGFAPPDRLLSTRQGVLEAYNFNADTGTVSGDPVVIAQGFLGGPAAVAASTTGVLAYRTGSAQRRQLVWVDRKGTVLRAIGEPDTGNNGSPELSADEQSAAVFSGRSGDNDIWIIELARGLARRVTDGPPADAHPLWDPDGQHVVYNSGRFPGSGGATRQSITGGPPEPLFASDVRGAALSWTRDRRYVLLRRANDKTGQDLVAVSMMGEPREIAVAASPFDETEGQFSPDGKWVALVSIESGRTEVYVQSFPEGKSRAQVSTGGGTQVRWSADGREIFYLAPDGELMAVAVALGGAAPVVKLPVVLFQTYLATGTNVVGNKPQYAVARDGRFLLNTAVESPAAPIVITNDWMKRLSK
ncbi:MAG TPA: protein kinase [Vicinamibacterales bacterium]|jgi:Tol biopolymer transport system component/tRNA A-37 threonylcarbamoyl transferase component Bud32